MQPLGKFKIYKFESYGTFICTDHVGTGNDITMIGYFENDPNKKRHDFTQHKRDIKL